MLVGGLRGPADRRCESAAVSDGIRRRDHPSSSSVRPSVLPGDNIDRRLTFGCSPLSSRSHGGATALRDARDRRSNRTEDAIIHAATIENRGRIKFFGAI